VERVDVEGISLNPHTMILISNRQQQIIATITPPDATITSIQWISRNPAIVSVNNNGIVRGESLGTCFVVAITDDGNFKDSCEITVVQGVTNVTLNHTNLQISLSETIQLEATVMPSDAYNKKTIWNSSNSTIASVDDNGLVTGNAMGTAIILVITQDGSYEAECLVEVLDGISAPSGFSPNGDGINDYFVFTLNKNEVYSLSVFDKSGQVHYQSQNYKNDWNGIANKGPLSGKKVPAGTYFYSLKNKNTSSKTGYIVIKY
jgi:gliding motility-associated-like protein